jgi:hypothetical protein
VFTEQLPLWFLVLAIFLPRISLVIAYFTDTLLLYPLHGTVPPVLTVIVPRVLVLVLIYMDRGLSWWLLVHGLALAAVYIGVGESA